jgi:RND family efflux transporter MFP subunit
MVVVAAGLGYRYYLFQQAKQLAVDTAMRSVSVVHPAHGVAAAKISFPGQLEGFTSASVYARVNGYLKSWSKDIGAVVKAGDVLAQIDSPEVDQQYEQAKSDVLASSSAERLAEVSFQRWQNLLGVEAVSQQEVDQRSAELESKRALKRISESSLERAKTFNGYKNLTAPFSGIVTERNIDVGDLVSNGGGKRLFVVTNIDKLRLYIQLPQIYLNDIRPGLEVTVSVPEYPGKEFKAQVVRSSGAVSNQTGASLVEIAIDNADHKLTAGEYASVSMSLPFDASLLRIPASALIVHKEGTFVAEVDKDSRVKLVPVKVSKDLGQEIEIVGDVAEDSNIIGTPADTLIEGEKVKIYAPETSEQKAGH